MDKDNPLKKWILGKLDIHMQDDEVGFSYKTIHKKLTQNRSKT
jgi:hypothetical protein